MRAVRHDDRHDRVPHHQVGLGAGANGLEDPGGVHAGHAHPVGMLACTFHGVGRVDGGRVHADEHFPGRWFRGGEVESGQDVG